MGEIEDFRIGECMAWLRYARAVRKRIDAIDDMISVVWRLADVGGVDYAKAAVSSSTVADSIGEAVAEIEERTAQWRDERDAAVAEYMDALRVVWRVEEPTYRGIIVHRYLEGEDWDAVGDAIGYNANYACGYLNAPAVLALHPHLPPEWRTQIPNAME